MKSWMCDLGYTVAYDTSLENRCAINSRLLKIGILYLVLISTFEGLILSFYKCWLHHTNIYSYKQYTEVRASKTDASGEEEKQRQRSCGSENGEKPQDDGSDDSSAENVCIMQWLPLCGVSFDNNHILIRYPQERDHEPTANSRFHP